MLDYGKPDGKNTKRGHVVVSAANEQQLIEKITHYM
jgi:hypothetical protein